MKVFPIFLVLFLVIQLLSTSNASFSAAYGILKSGGTLFSIFYALFFDSNQETSAESNHQFKNDVLEQLDKLKTNMKHHKYQLITHQSNSVIKHFQTNVGLRAQIYYSLLQEYRNNPRDQKIRNFFEKECLYSSPYSALLNLNILVTEKILLQYARYINYKFNETETFRAQIMHAANQLGYAEILCNSYDGDKSGNLTKRLVSSVIMNITTTVEKQLKTINTEFFPEHVTTAVLMMLHNITVTGTQKEKNTEVARKLTNMLIENYSYGQFATKNRHFLRNNAYTVYVSQKPFFGELPFEGTIILYHDGYHILIYRSIVAEIAEDAKHEKFVAELKKSHTFCHNSLSTDAVLEIKSNCVYHDFCVVSQYDDNAAAYGQNNVMLSAHKLCEHSRTVITGLPFGSASSEIEPKVEKKFEFDLLKNLKENNLLFF